MMKRMVPLAALGLMSFGVWAGSMTIYSEWGDEIWCEDQYVAMNTLKNESWQLGDGPVTIRLDEDLALSETFDFSWIDRDITLDLNGNALTSDAGADWFSDELLNIELQDGHSFTLQDGSVTGAKSKGAVRIAAGQRVTVKNVTFENNHCDGTLGDLWEGDVGGAIRCNGNLKLVGCTFRNNSCTTHGGAVGIYSNDYQSRFVIENCTFENNTAVEAGGALFLGCSGRIQNTTITGNTVTGREDGAELGQNDIPVGQGGGVFLTRHGGVSYGDESEGFWWGRFEGPTVMIEEGVVIDGNKASQKNGEAERTNNLYLSRHENSYNNAAVRVSGDTRSETRVGLTLSDEDDGVFTRTLNEEGGEWLTDDYSVWFFCDTAAWMRAVYDADEGLIRLADCRLAPGGEPQTLKADSAEEAAAAATELFMPSQEVADALDEASAAEYSKLFAPVVAPVADTPGSWMVSYAPTEEGTNKLEKAVNDAPAKVLSAVTALAAGEPAEVEMDVVPGFYYAVKYGSTPDVACTTEGELAKGPKLKLQVPAVKASSAFFRVVVSEKKIAARGEE